MPMLLGMVLQQTQPAPMPLDTGHKQQAEMHMPSVMMQKPPDLMPMPSEMMR